MDKIEAVQGDVKRKGKDLVLYRFFDDDDELLYVGKSIRVWSRFVSHQQSRVFYPEAAKVTLQRGFASHEELIAAEKFAILDEQPKFNKVHKNPPKPKRDPVTGCYADPHPCGVDHFCGWRKHQNGIGSCRDRDKKDFDIVARLNAGEPAEQVAARHNTTADQAIYTAYRIRLGREKGQHGCVECPQTPQD